jgi:predicted secreted protein
VSRTDTVVRAARFAARLCLGASLLVGVVSPASAGPTLAFDAQARSEIANDEMVVVLAAERDGPQVGPLNDAVIAQLNAAIAEAKAVEGVRTRIGSISTQPNFVRDGRQQGWRVRGELVLVSNRIPALSQLGGRLADRLQVSSVQFRLSAERRRSEEARLLAEAATAFRTKAGEAALAFGFKGYELKELTLRNSGQGMPRPMAMARGGPESVAAAPPLPAEGGESEVVVAVSGTVVLLP